MSTSQAGLDKSASRYRLGLSCLERDAVQHAVAADGGISLCGEQVSPLPTLGWSLPFVPTVTRACRACVRLAEKPDGVVPHGQS
ncbi:hypothetical protein GCM10012278_17620 [Nonomuraea glycinis]|uniref:Uncharacterized protein n=1 Tax=Nonomuraea glycinis TaxID=2047744 RepID=A0A918A421_9ACTN|nr:hypothetical protein GCM10012278_17620 [Nonomuraea glycinis]